MMTPRPTLLPDGTTAVLVPIDDATYAWLVGLAEMCHAEPALIAARWGEE